MQQLMRPSSLVVLLWLSFTDADPKLATQLLLNTLGGGNETSPAELSLQCSACYTLAEKMQSTLFDPKYDEARTIVTNWKEWTTEERVKGLKDAMMAHPFGTCPKIGRLNIAQIGIAPRRQLGDYDALMKRGGTVDNLETGPEKSKAVQALCEVLAKGDDLAGLVTHLEKTTGVNSKKKKKRRKRLMDLKMIDEVCQGFLSLGCPRRKGGEDDDDDADDSDYRTSMADEL